MTRLNVDIKIYKFCKVKIDIYLMGEINSLNIFNFFAFSPEYVNWR